MVTFFRWVGSRLVVASMFVAIVAGGGSSPSGIFAVKAAHAAVSYSSGTTDPNQVPAMACAKVKALWPAWTIKSYSVKPGAVVVGATNAKGTKASFTVQVISRLERGRMTYYVGSVTGPY